MKDLRIRAASINDLKAIKALLVEADLPVEDLHEQKMPFFRLAESAGGCVGAIGMERYGNIGLLRSLVVSPAARGQGLGKVLVDTLERDVVPAGVEELWLLTIDAEEFFKLRHFEIISREHAPDTIRDTEEFSSLCPDSAHLMMKSIA